MGECEYDYFVVVNDEWKIEGESVKIGAAVSIWAVMIDPWRLYEVLGNNAVFVKQSER